MPVCMQHPDPNFWEELYSVLLDIPPIHEIWHSLEEQGKHLVSWGGGFPVPQGKCLPPAAALCLLLFCCILSSRLFLRSCLEGRTTEVDLSHSPCQLDLRPFTTELPSRAGQLECWSAPSLLCCETAGGLVSIQVWWEVEFACVVINPSLH